jgi:malate synthase
MEDLATGRMSVAQIAQRVRHAARDAETGQVHDFALVRSLLHEEVEDILRLHREDAGELDTVGEAAFVAGAERYRKAVKIAMRWIKNYADLDFRSLGSYTRADLEAIAAAEEAF